MADFKFEISPEWERALQKLDGLYDEVAPKMLEKADAIVAAALKSTKFGKYVKVKKPKKNKYGWFSQVQFRGKTSSGEPAAKAATVYEYGRNVDASKDGISIQPARPEIRPKVASVEPEAINAMEQVMEEALKKL